MKVDQKNRKNGMCQTVFGFPIIVHVIVLLPASFVLFAYLLVSKGRPSVGLGFLQEMEKNNQNALVFVILY